jgi:2-phosphosulfolactate phosphatase
MIPIETILTPADIRALAERDLTDAVCVVFDVLRATSTMVTALANGAGRILPVQEIEDVLLMKRSLPLALLAGERGGHRITAKISGSVEFDLGNSPREFTADTVHGKTIIMTTTNGTRALRSVSTARCVLVGSLLNLSATADAVRTLRPSRVLLVCAGTAEGAAYEDILAAGALIELLLPGQAEELREDASRMALDLVRAAGADLGAALQRGINGRRLSADPTLREDIAFCARRDAIPIVVSVDAGVATQVPFISP